MKMLLIGCGLVALLAATIGGLTYLANDLAGKLAEQSLDTTVYQAQVIRVVDGDTLEVSYEQPESETVRLIGIDAEESVHPDESKNTEEGREASDHLKGILPEGSVVYLEPGIEERDDYGRMLAYVWLTEPTTEGDWMDTVAARAQEAPDAMLNAILVADGWAEPMTVEPNTRYKTVFETLASNGSN